MLAATVGYLGYGTFVQNGQIPWKLPATTSILFWGFSLHCLAEEGLATVWRNHNQNFWGNQVLFDLCFSIAIFWFTLLPRARAVGMTALPWLVYICTTGSIGGLHWYARILYLEERKRNMLRAEGPSSHQTNVKTL